MTKVKKRGVDDGNKSLIKNRGARKHIQNCEKDEIIKRASSSPLQWMANVVIARAKKFRAQHELTFRNASTS